MKNNSHYYPMFYQSPQYGTKDEPTPPMTKDKLCYQNRHAVSPTMTNNMRFMDSAEGGLLPMQRSEDVMRYTEINGREPTGPEKGMAPPPGQNRMGA